MAPTQSTAVTPPSAAAQLELLGLKAKEAVEIRVAVTKQQEFDNSVALDAQNGIESPCRMREVWAWNFEEEFDALLATIAGETNVMLALDMEFPGFVSVEPRVGPINVRYQALRENVDSLRPIQLGAAVASGDGTLRGVWTFNLSFDVEVDLHTEQSVAFLRAAGLNFPRHAAEGIDCVTLGRRLAASYLVGQHGRSPYWITFSGAYDLGYLLKILTNGQPLPQEPSSFDSVLSVFCPRRHELRDHLPYGSLESLSRKHRITRYGVAHTAGSDALLTLELFLKIQGRGRYNKQWAAEEAWDGSANLYGMESWYPGWDNSGWGAPVRWEDQYNQFNFNFQQAAAAGPWMSHMLPGGAGTTSYMGQAMQHSQLKASHPPVWPDAATAALLKSSGWYAPDSTAVSTQVLAI